MDPVSAAESPSDIALLARYVHRRDLDAVTTLIDRHQRDLLRTAHALLGDAEAAQDVVQDALLKLCREAAGLVAHAGARTALGGWLATVVRHQAFDRLRRPDLAPVGDAIGELSANETAPPNHEALWQAVANLPTLSRAAVLLRYRDGLAYRDIAERLDKSVSHIGVLLHEGLARLRAMPELRSDA